MFDSLEQSSKLVPCRRSSHSKIHTVVAQNYRLPNVVQLVYHHAKPQKKVRKNIPTHLPVKKAQFLTVLECNFLTACQSLIFLLFLLFSMTFSHIRHTSVGENIFRSLTNPKTHFPTGKTIASRKTRSRTFAEKKIAWFSNGKAFF